MAKGKKKITKKTAKSKATKKVVKTDTRKLHNDPQALKNLSAQLKLGESYVSLILGAIVVLVIFVLFLIVVLGKSIHQNQTKTSMQTSATPTKTANQTRTYVLKDGEGLWDVAVKFYGDGYKWTVISDANNLADNPDAVVPGMKLVVPYLK